MAAAGRGADAEALLTDAAKSWPFDAGLLSALAQARWARGAGADFAQPLEAALNARPGDLGLRLACVSLLHHAEFTERAESLLREGFQQHPDAPQLWSSLGVLLDEAGRTDEALPAHTRAVAIAPHIPAYRMNLVTALLRAGRPGEALTEVRLLRAAAPNDQVLVAREALALRMLGDPLYKELYDYDALVRVYQLPSPPALPDLVQSLRALHTASAHPLEQSLRNGTQSAGNLLDSPDPTIKAFFAALDAPIRAYIEALPPASLMGKRRASGYRLVGAWSARLRPGGYHANHVHNHGWISSAFYAVTPPDVKTSEARAGWLKFGEPNLPIPGCGPEYFVQPEPGLLVLFPSYMWHGTVPFQDGEERLTAAFDVAPT